MVHEANRLTRSDERHRTVVDARELRRPPMRALDLQQQRCEMRRPLEHLTGLSVERSPLIEDDFDACALRRHHGGNLEAHDMGWRCVPESAPSQTAMERAHTIDRNSSLDRSRTHRGSRVPANPRAIAINNSDAVRAGRMYSAALA
jgi:hypothetical protein